MGVDELDALYFHGSVREVAKAVAAFTTAYDLTRREMYEKVLGDFRNGETPDINRDLYEAYSKNLRKAVNDVLQSGSYGDPYFDMQMQFEANVSRFAAYKAYQATKELSELEPGQLDTVGRAKLNKYNRWQATEYNTAMARARTARQFTDFTSDPKAKLLYPNLKWLPSRSAHPREAHHDFWNKVWAKDDPFWDENTPGSLWNCKCDWRETDEPVTDGNPGGNVSQKGLTGNPARTGEVFTDECPYIKKTDSKGEKAVDTFWKPIEEHHSQFVQYAKDANYENVEFNWDNGGMKATHKNHSFAPDKGHYEEEVQNIAFNNGYSVILTSEKGKGIGENYTEGLWNNKNFEIATCENANTNNNNIVKGLKHCASKDGNEVAILYFYEGKFIKNDVKRAIGRYDGMKDDLPSYKKFKAIYVLCEEKVYQLQ